MSPLLTRCMYVLVRLYRMVLCILFGKFSCKIIECWPLWWIRKDQYLPLQWLQWWGLLHSIKDCKSAFICPCHLSINDFSDGDYTYQIPYSMKCTVVKVNNDSERPSDLSVAMLEGDVVRSRLQQKWSDAMMTWI